MLFFISFILAFILCWIIIITKQWHGSFSGDYDLTGIQKFHKVATPRIGGLAIFISAWLIAIYGILQNFLWAIYFIKILAPSSLVFMAGFLEDLIKKITPWQRIFMTLLAALLGIYAVHVINRITHTDITIIDYVLRFELVSLIITLIILIGVTNAFNIIDGYNGLCLTTFLSIMICCLVIAYRIDFHYLDNSIWILSGAVLGLMLWNYPHGKIFLGDGGAYFLGFIATLILLEISQRIPGYSPFTSFLIMIYPISETALSIYRKKFIRKRSPFEPDRLHMHMVVYYRLIKKDIANRNAAVVVKMLWFIVPQLVIAMLFYSQQKIILTAIILYFIGYFWLYFRMVCFNKPWFLK